MNTVSLIGRLTRDPELRSMGQSDRQVCNMRVAVDNGPERKPTFIDVKTFDGSAKACQKYLSSGSRVGVSGRLIYEEWESNGDKRSRHSVIGRVEFLEPKSDRNGANSDSEESSATEPETAAPASAGGSDDDIPF